MLTFDPAVPLEHRRNAARLKGSRITLAVLLHVYLRDPRPVALSEAYDHLDPADVRAVVAWYHANKAGADEYLAEHDREAERLRLEVEAAQVARGQPTSAQWWAELRRRFAERQAARRMACGVVPEPPPTP